MWHCHRYGHLRWRRKTLWRQRYHISKQSSYVTGKSTGTWKAIICIVDYISIRFCSTWPIAVTILDVWYPVNLPGGMIPPQFSVSKRYVRWELTAATGMPSSAQMTMTNMSYDMQINGRNHHMRRWKLLRSCGLITIRRRNYNWYTAAAQQWPHYRKHSECNSPASAWKSVCRVELEVTALSTFDTARVKSMKLMCYGSRRLQLNASKTEVMWFGSAASLRGLTASDKNVDIGNATVQPVDSVETWAFIWTVCLTCMSTSRRQRRHVTSNYGVCDWSAVYLAAT